MVHRRRSLRLPGFLWKFKHEEEKRQKKFPLFSHFEIASSTFQTEKKVYSLFAFFSIPNGILLIDTKKTKNRKAKLLIVIKKNS